MDAILAIGGRNSINNANAHGLGYGTGSSGTAEYTESPQERWVSAGNKYSDPDLIFNAFAHQREGQNVLYNDGHVKFETTANVGVDNDNIWTMWKSLGSQTKPTAKQREVGDGSNGWFTRHGSGANAYSATAAQYMPESVDDAFLINEYQDSGLTAVCP
jgi:prepilin-type processing-associated H-X9-DG protein